MGLILLFIAINEKPNKLATLECDKSCREAASHIGPEGAVYASLYKFRFVKQLQFEFRATALAPAVVPSARSLRQLSA